MTDIQIRFYFDMKSLAQLGITLVVVFSALLSHSQRAFGQSDSTWIEQPQTRHVISIAPLGVVNKLRTSYYNIHEGYTIGGHLSYYYSGFQGIQANPQLRIHFGTRPHSAFYIMANAPFFAGKSMGWTETYTSGNGDVERYKYTDVRITSVGGGAALGYFAFLGNSKRFFIDTYLGAKISTYRQHDTRRVIFLNDGTSQEAGQRFLEGLSWYLVGPGSVFQGHFGIGWRL